MNNANRCTVKQANILAQFGYDPNVTFDQARQILDQLKAHGWRRPDGNPLGHDPNRARNAANPNSRCTDKQAAVLRKFGYDPNVTFDQARQILDQLKANNWQRIQQTAPVAPQPVPNPQSTQYVPQPVQSQPVQAPQPAPVSQPVAVPPQYQTPPSSSPYPDLPSFNQ